MAIDPPNSDNPTPQIPVRRVLTPVLAAGFVAVSVALSAYGAHGAEQSVAHLFSLAGQYGMIHGAAAFLITALGAQPRFSWPARLILIGAVIFAASLCGLAVGAPRWFGAITPFGGATMITGWGLAALATWQKPT